jgi:hypothetical protein
MPHTNTAPIFQANLVDDLTMIKVTLDNGKSYSLFTIYEQGLGTPMCCPDVDCPGCLDTDPADRETWESR